MKFRFRKAQIERYNKVSDAILFDLLDGRDFYSALYGQGITFVEDIALYKEWAKDNAPDVYENFTKKTI